MSPLEPRPKDIHLEKVWKENVLSNVTNAMILLKSYLVANKMIESDSTLSCHTLNKRQFYNVLQEYEKRTEVVNVMNV